MVIYKYKLFSSLSVRAGLLIGILSGIQYEPLEFLACGVLVWWSHEWRGSLCSSTGTAREVRTHNEWRC